MKLLCFIPLLIIIVLTSCSTIGNLTIEKRHYRDGFYINYHKQTNEKEKEPERIAIIQQSTHLNSVYDSAVTASPVISEKDITSVCVKSLGNKIQTVKKRFQQNPVSFNTGSGTKSQPKPNIKSLPRETSGDAEGNQFLCIIVAIFFPALGLYLYEGNSSNFHKALIIGGIALLLLLMSLFLSFFVYYIPLLFSLLAGLLYLADKIFAILKILNK